MPPEGGGTCYSLILLLVFSFVFDLVSVCKVSYLVESSQGSFHQDRL